MSNHCGPPAPDATVVVGEPCDPLNISPDQAAVATANDLVCQLTDELCEVRMPARFMNAKKGDVILSPGGTGLIGGLLRQVDPPQIYSHSGIMTRNYDEVTHSTASEKRMVDHADTHGVEPSSVLKWMWPGVVRQSVEAAIFGEDFPDPNGAMYSIKSFSPYTIGYSHNDAWVTVPPLVVKPDPVQETAQVRSKLHEVALAARTGAGRPGVNSKSHYRLFAYTDPSIGTTETAPAEAGWAQGSFPSVCSSFIWMALKAAGVPLESNTAQVLPLDLEDADVDEGAQVMPSTPDGLYKYTAGERLAAGQWLYNELYNVAYEEAGWLGRLFTDAPDDLANQICNTFAVDDENGQDHENWKAAVDANAVSPDNLIFYDGPAHNGVYGAVEPLIYREPRMESYQVSRWRHVPTRGDVRGIVTRGGEPVHGAEVIVYDGKSDHTDASGNYAIDDVPFGLYQIRASKVIDGALHSAQAALNVDQPNETVNLELQPPADHFRRALIFLDFYGQDYETFGSNEIHNPGPEYHERPLGPDLLTTSLSKVYRWGGEMRAEYTVDISYLHDQSLQVSIHGVLYEGTSEDTGDIDGTGSVSFNVPKGESKFARLKITNQDEDDPDDYGQFDLTVENALNTN